MPASSTMAHTNTRNLPKPDLFLYDNMIITPFLFSLYVHFAGRFYYPLFRPKTTVFDWLTDDIVVDYVWVRSNVDQLKEIVFYNNKTGIREMLFDMEQLIDIHSHILPGVEEVGCPTK